RGLVARGLGARLAVRRVGGPARAEAVRPAGALECAGERSSEGCRRQRVPVRRQVVVRRALVADGALADDEVADGDVRLERARGPDRDEAPDAERDEPLEDDGGGWRADAEPADDGNAPPALDKVEEPWQETVAWLDLVVRPDVREELLRVAEDDSLGWRPRGHLPAGALVREVMLGLDERPLGVLASEVRVSHASQ